MKWKVPCQVIETVTYEVEASDWDEAVAIVAYRWERESEEGVIDRQLDLGGPFEAFEVKS